MQNSFYSPNKKVFPKLGLLLCSPTIYGYTKSNNFFIFVKNTYLLLPRIVKPFSEFLLYRIIKAAVSLLPGSDIFGQLEICETAQMFHFM